MAYLNQVQLIGNVGSDPEVRSLQGGATTASFRLAVSERFKDRNGNKQENTEWVNITVWNTRAEFVQKYLHKGSNVFLSGKLRTRQWTDKENNKRYTTEVVAENIQILDKKAPAQAPVDDDLPEFLQ
jgi:single-strand DNA-binding protein